MKLSLERKVALDAVVKACKICLSVQGNLGEGDSVTKKDSTPVTVADFAVQAVVIQTISEKFPEDGYVAEETSKMLKEKSELRENVLKYVKQVLPNFTETQLIHVIEKGQSSGGSTRRWGENSF